MVAAVRCVLLCCCFVKTELNQGEYKTSHVFVGCCLLFVGVGAVVCCLLIVGRCCLVCAAVLLFCENGFNA